jgi:uncharacterized protein (TIGR00730 family)
MNKRVCIFCGANTGNSSEIIQQALVLCDLLVEAGYDLVYGGGETGLMGLCANRFIASGRGVIGIRPKKLIADENSHSGLTELIVVETMSDRKNKMIELSDFFIALPGGTGTLDEIIETYTLHKIGFINKPSGVLNTDGYYDGLKVLLDKMDDIGFLKGAAKDLLIIADTPDALMSEMRLD